jgi:hypothetical protein
MDADRVIVFNANAMQEGGENHIRPQEFFPALPHPPTLFLFPSTVFKWEDARDHALGI